MGQGLCEEATSASAPSLSGFSAVSSITAWEAGGDGGRKGVRCSSPSLLLLQAAVGPTMSANDLLLQKQVPKVRFEMLVLEGGSRPWLLIFSVIENSLLVRNLC